MRRPGAASPAGVFSRAELMATCLAEGDTVEPTVQSRVSKLHKKLEDLGVNGIRVSVRGVGNKLWSDE